MSFIIQFLPFLIFKRKTNIFLSFIYYKSGRKGFSIFFLNPEMTFVCPFIASCSNCLSVSIFSLTFRYNDRPQSQKKPHRFERNSFPHKGQLMPVPKTNFSFPSSSSLIRALKLELSFFLKLYGPIIFSLINSSKMNGVISILLHISFTLSSTLTQALSKLFLLSVSF